MIQLHCLALTLAFAVHGEKVYSLKDGELTHPHLVPLALERPLVQGIPDGLLPEPRLIEKQGRKLKVDTDGDGRMDKTVSASKPTVIEFEFEDHDRSLLLYSKQGVWMACPARLWRAKIGKDTLELLDANMDGGFGGPEDWLRWKDGCFFRHEVEGLLPVEDGLAQFKVVPGTRKAKLTLEPLPRPEWANDLQWSALRAVNDLRVASGLGPWALDMERSVACQKHAEYLYLNNYDYTAPWDGVGSHDEVEGKPGFSEEGRDAARNSATSGSDDPAGAVIRQFKTMLHRVGYLGSSTSPFAVGSVDRSKNSARGYSVLWGSDPDPTSITEVVVHPGPGQQLNELNGGGERPHVERDPRFYDRPRGYPVSVSFGRLPLQGVELRVFAEVRRTRSRASSSRLSSPFTVRARPTHTQPSFHPKSP